MSYDNPREYIVTNEDAYAAAILDYATGGKGVPYKDNPNRSWAQYKTDMMRMHGRPKSYPCLVTLYWTPNNDLECIGPAFPNLNARIVHKEDLLRTINDATRTLRRLDEVGGAA